MEIDLATKAIRNLTAHYPHHGYTRALYLANGDILLSGPESFDPRKPGEARWNRAFCTCWTRAGRSRPCRSACGATKARPCRASGCTSPGPSGATSQSGDSSQINEADVVFEDGTPKLANRRPVLDNRDLPFRCRMETQNFRPPDERELIFSAYAIAGDKCDVCGVDLATKKVTKYTDSPDEYDEPEGIFPDGQPTLVECDRQNHQGPGHIDLWKLALDGSGRYERLTHFSDYPGYKASNPVVSDDGRFIAFQMGHSGDAAGVGHGIFVYDVEKAESAIANDFRLALGKLKFDHGPA